MPAVGWLQLSVTVGSQGESQRKLEAEMDENAREREALADQIRIFQQKQGELEVRNKELVEQMKKVEDLALLQAESQSIAILGQKEAASLAKVEEKMKNAYFMEDFDSEDVSSVFSMFQMDTLFDRFRENETDNNLETTLITPLEHLQSKLKLEFSEAVELLWKLKLLESGEKGMPRHLSKCSICSKTKIGVLLQEYGMTEATKKEIEVKIKDWKGYFLATVNPVSAALALDVEGGLKSQLTTCLLRIQRVHKWNFPDD